jgi:hypothetical protein
MSDASLVLADVTRALVYNLTAVALPRLLPQRNFFVE